MGLGKTLQLLTFIVWCLEHDPAVDPFLIVAPVSLLENWKQEIDKFFEPGTLPVLTLYGPTLREKRLPRAAIQEELLSALVSPDYLSVAGWGMRKWYSRHTRRLGILSFRLPGRSGRS